MWYRFIKTSQKKLTDIKSVEYEFNKLYKKIIDQNLDLDNGQKLIEDLKKDLLYTYPGDSILINSFYDEYSRKLGFTPTIDQEIESPITTDNKSNLNENWMSVAESYLGTPYKFGGESEKGIDCSAFVQRVFPNLPRTADEQMKVGISIPIDNQSEWKPGDRIYFDIGPRLAKGDADHTGIYLGNNMFIQSSVSSGVSKTPLNDYYRSKIIKVMR